MYWHRYLRITPLLAATVLFTMSLFRFVGSGPFWPYLNWFLVGACNKHWWSTLLHFQNYESKEGMVRFAVPKMISLWRLLQIYIFLSMLHKLIPHFPRKKCCKYIHLSPIKTQLTQNKSTIFSECSVCHSWYLSVDMQLFIIAPALAYLVHRFKKTAILVILAAMLISMVWIVFIHIDTNMTNTYAFLLIPDFVLITIPRRSNHFSISIIWHIFRYHPGVSRIFIPTHFRLPSWLVGFMTGILFVDYPMGTIRIPKVKWIACQKIWPEPIWLVAVLSSFRYWIYAPGSSHWHWW